MQHSCFAVLRGDRDADQLKNRGRIVVVEMTASFDSNTAGIAGDKMTALANGASKQMVLNLQHLDYVSSAGLRIIVRTAKLLQAHQGELKLCAANLTVKQALVTSGFNALIKLVDTEDEAIRSFPATGAA